MIYGYCLKLSHVVNQISFLHNFLFFCSYSSAFCLFVSVSLCLSLIYPQLSGSIILASVFSAPARNPPGGPWPLVLIQPGHPLRPLPHPHGPGPPLLSPGLDSPSSSFLAFFSLTLILVAPSSISFQGKGAWRSTGWRIFIFEHVLILPCIYQQLMNSFPRYRILDLV